MKAQKKLLILLFMLGLQADMEVQLDTQVMEWAKLIWMKELLV